jgi:glycosyltransferase involved in cell wall biosynthesis
MVLFTHQNIMDIRNPHCEVRWRRFPWLYFQLEKRYLRRMSWVYCVNREGVRYYRDTYPDMADRIAFVPTWVDEEVFYPRPAPERQMLRRRLLAELNPGSPPSRIVLFVGRLEGPKDPELLLASFRALLQLEPGAALAIVGTGTLEPSVRRRAAELGLGDRVFFLGPRPQQEVAELLNAADLLLLTSAFEGMPMTVLEALGCGLPVVSTDVGEVGLVVRDGTSGMLVKECNPEALARAVVRVIGLKAAGQITVETCVASVAPYLARTVLKEMYDLHRRLAGTATAGLKDP